MRPFLHRRSAFAEARPLPSAIRVYAAAYLDLRDPLGSLFARTIADLADVADRVDAQRPDEVRPRAMALDAFLRREALAAAHRAGLRGDPLQLDR